MRCRRPSVGERPEQELAERDGRLEPAGLRERASISPFHDAIALSSRAGFGRCSRSSNSRVRSRLVELAAKDEAPVLERLQQLLGRPFARAPT